MVDLNKGATVELVKALSDDIRTLPDGTKAASAGAAVRASAFIRAMSKGNVLEARKTISSDSLAWTIGSIIANGVENNSSIRLKTKNYLDSFDYNTVIISSDTSGYLITCVWYDENYQVVITSPTFHAISTSTVFTLPSPPQSGRFVRFVLKKSDESAVTVADGEHVIITVCPVLSMLTQNIAYRTDAEAAYPHRYFKILDELTPDFKSESGDRSNNAWNLTDTTKRHILLPAFPDDTERVVMLRQNNDNLSVKTIKILADESSQYVQFDSYIALIDNPDYAIPTRIIPASGQLAVVFSLEDTQMADGYFSSFPLSFVDSYVAKYGMSKNEILAQSYDTSSDNLFPRDRRLWHKVYDIVERGELLRNLVPATTGRTVGALQSAFIPYDSVQKVSVSHHTADYSLGIIGVDENYNPVCWTAGGVPATTQTETFTLKSGKTVHDIKYISYFLKSTTGAMLNADTLDFDTINIRVRLYDNLTPHRIRIMEYNMGHYNFGVGVGLDSSTADRYITGMKNLFGNYRPDVLFATEYTDTLVSGDSRSANTVLFNPVFKFASNTDGKWNTIRSVYSLSNISSGYILPASTYSNSKPYRYAEININNHSVGLCCVHFLAVFPDSGSEFQNIVEARAYEMEQALALFDNMDYGILAGDFNCLNAGEKEALNQMAVAKEFTPVNGGYFGWKATLNNINPTTYPDNIYVKGDIKISSFSVLAAEVSELPSDHIPIIADIIVY